MRLSFFAPATWRETLKRARIIRFSMTCAQNETFLLLYKYIEEDQAHHLLLVCVCWGKGGGGNGFKEPISSGMPCMTISLMLSAFEIRIDFHPNSHQHGRGLDGDSSYSCHRRNSK